MLDEGIHSFGILKFCYFQGYVFKTLYWKCYKI